MRSFVVSKLGLEPLDAPFVLVETVAHRVEHPYQDEEDKSNPSLAAARNSVCSVDAEAE